MDRTILVSLKGHPEPDRLDEDAASPVERRAEPLNDWG